VITRAAAALAATCVLAACGSAAATATPTPAHTPTVTPSATPGPDSLTVSIQTIGIGTFDLVAFPVVVLHNNARRHGAEQVVVHFATAARDGRPMGSLDSVPVNLAPGQTLPVTADCTDACTSAAKATATLSVGGWVTSSGTIVSAGPVTYTCDVGCGGGQSRGDATATLTAPLGAGATVEVFAACSSRGGTILGGGYIELVWPGGSSVAVDVPTILRQPAVGCTVGASTGW
jgi:hypothetical protein